MKIFLLILCILSASSCLSQKYGNDNSYTYGKVLNLSSDKNSNPEKCSIRGWVYDKGYYNGIHINMNDDGLLSGIRVTARLIPFRTVGGSDYTAGRKSHYNYGFVINNLTEGYYEIEFSERNYYKFIVDSVFLRKGENITMTVEFNHRNTWGGN